MAEHVARGADAVAVGTAIVHLGDASPEVAAAGLAGMARGWPKGTAAPKGSTSMIVRLVYADGEQEDHPLVNGEHIADSIRRVDVPQSEFAFDLAGRQVRYLQIQPTWPEPLSAIEFVKGSDGTAPIVMAVTDEAFCRGLRSGQPVASGAVPR